MGGLAIFFFTVAVVMTGLMVWGLLASRKERGTDRPHRAAFVGFIAALVAAAAIILELIAGAPHTHPSSAVSGLLFVTGIIATVSILVTVVAGLLSGGVQRIGLVGYGAMLSLIYLFNAVGHFGD